MIVDYFLCDLDGCVSCDKWRFEKVDHSISDPDKRFYEYHRNMSLDKPAHVGIINAEAYKADPIFITARPERYRGATYKWINENFAFSLPHYRLLMRPNGNHDPSPQLKMWLLLQWLLKHPGSYIAGAFDDREDVIKMYIDLGIKSKLLIAEDYTRMDESGKEIAIL